MHCSGRLKSVVEGKGPAEATDASFKRRNGDGDPSATVFKGVKKLDKILFHDLRPLLRDTIATNTDYNVVCTGVFCKEAGAFFHNISHLSGWKTKALHGFSLNFSDDGIPYDKHGQTEFLMIKFEVMSLRTGRQCWWWGQTSGQWWGQDTKRRLGGGVINEQRCVGMGGEGECRSVETEREFELPVSGGKSWRSRMFYLLLSWISYDGGTQERCLPFFLWSQTVDQSSGGDGVEFVGALGFAPNWIQGSAAADEVLDGAAA